MMQSICNNQLPAINNRFALVSAKLMVPGPALLVPPAIVLFQEAASREIKHHGGMYRFSSSPR